MTAAQGAEYMGAGMRTARREIASTPHNLGFAHLDTDPRSILEEVRTGLLAAHKWLPPHLFYDAAGARLFEQICRTDAYYPTRTEISILRERSAQIAAGAGTRLTVIEPGAGDMRKVRLLLNELRPAAYIPIDVSEEQLIEEALALALGHPWLPVKALVGDFTKADLRPHLPGRPARLLFFPGSTIGNLDPDDAAAFLRRVRDLVGDDGKALVGVDLVKDVAVLDRAYNDPEGHTARFNLNLLVRLNRELATDFEVSAFAHRAFYDAAKQRIEMHLVSRQAQTVKLRGESIRFAAGETIHTENSYKYRIDQFADLAGATGFALRACWRDARDWFGLFLLEAVR